MLARRRSRVERGKHAQLVAGMRCSVGRNPAPDTSDEVGPSRPQDGGPSSGTKRRGESIHLTRGRNTHGKMSVDRIETVSKRTGGRPSIPSTIPRCGGRCESQSDIASEWSRGPLLGFRDSSIASRNRWISTRKAAVSLSFSRLAGARNHVARKPDRVPDKPTPACPRTEGWRCYRTPAAGSRPAPQVRTCSGLGAS